MIRKNASSAPKLKVKGAETRKLIPVLVVLCYKHLDMTKAVEQAAANCLSSLLECYKALDLRPYDAKVLQHCARRFALLYTSLTEHFADEISWRVKPKFHLLMHLAEATTCPKEVWCYRDEDFGGSAAAMVRAKGGWNTRASSATRVLDKFRAFNRLPILGSANVPCCCNVQAVMQNICDACNSRNGIEIVRRRFLRSLSIKCRCFK